jgi:hypothetical protein
LFANGPGIKILTLNINARYRIKGSGLPRNGCSHERWTHKEGPRNEQAWTHRKPSQDDARQEGSQAPLCFRLQAEEGHVQALPQGGQGHAQGGQAFLLSTFAFLKDN